MKIPGAPDESDYAAFTRQTEENGFSFAAIKAAAKHLKKGTMRGLDGLLSELAARGKTDEKEIDSYLTERETYAAAVYKIARKLGAKVENPAAYVDEYAEKWFNYGFEEESLCDLAGYCFKCNLTDFSSLDSLVEQLFSKGIVGAESVREIFEIEKRRFKTFRKTARRVRKFKKSPPQTSPCSKRGKAGIFPTR